MKHTIPLVTFPNRKPLPAYHIQSKLPGALNQSTIETQLTFATFFHFLPSSFMFYHHMNPIFKYMYKQHHQFLCSTTPLQSEQRSLNPPDCFMLTDRHGDMEIRHRSTCPTFILSHLIFGDDQMISKQRGPFETLNPK